MATASRTNSGQYDAKYTSVLEYWFNSDKAQDVVFRPTVLGWILNQLKRSKPLPPDTTVRLLMDQANGIDSFEFFDTVSTATSPGTKAARYGLAHYSGPIAMSLQEELDLTSPEAIADALAIKVRQVEMTLAQRFAKDFYRGTYTSSKNVIGLEQILFPADQASGDGNVDYERWQYRKHANVFAGIQRSAYTAAEAGGTGWEACTGGANGAAIAYSSGVPNATGKILTKLYDAASYGIEHPNLLVSGTRAWDDFIWATEGRLTVERMASQFTDAEITIDNIKFRGAMWVPDELSNTYDVAGGVVNAGQLGNIYGINTDHLALLVDSRLDMVLTPSRSPVDQHSGVRHVVWRGQLVTDNPRMLFRLFNYPG